MGFFSKTWKALSIGIAIYTAYQKIQSLRQASADLYTGLSPDQQSEWAQYFGVPSLVPGGGAPITNPVVTPTIVPKTVVSTAQPSIVSSLTSNLPASVQSAATSAAQAVVTQLSQVKAGT